MTEPITDPTGALITELRNAGVASRRVRGGEPAGKTASYEGDALGPGEYKRFVVLARLGSDQRWRRAGVRAHRIGVRAYGVDAADAADLFGEISRLLDAAGPRIGVGSVAIHQSLDVSGGNAQRDPATGQPYEDGVIELIARTEVLAGS
jgi:hypothetical protein